MTVVSFCALISGCAATSSNNAAPTSGETPPPIAVAAPRTVIDARPAALIDGFGIAYGDLLPALVEAAGAEALRELIIDRALERRFREEGLTLESSDLARENRILLESLHEDVNRATRLLEELRRRRGLGDVRYDRLVRRSAMLRTLVRDDAVPTGRAIDDAVDARFGPKREVRLILVDDLSEALRLRDRATSGAFFGELAARFSNDSSAPRGGLLEPMSARDPSWPQAVRDEVFRIAEPGEISPPVRLEEGFALFQLVELIPAVTGSPEAQRAIAEREVRLSLERLRMDELARDLIGESRVTLLDRALEDAWRRGVRD